MVQVLKEVERMGALARENFLNSMEALFHKDPQKLEEVAENEKVLNFLNQKITEYLVQINGLELQDPDHEVIGALFHVVSDFERIGDHSTNIGEMAQIIIDKKASLSETAVKELQHMQELVVTIPVSYTHLVMVKMPTQLCWSELVRRTLAQIARWPGWCFNASWKKRLTGWVVAVTRHRCNAWRTF